MAAIAVQAGWAPFLFYKFSPFLLPLDASVSGYLLTYFIPGADWAGTIIRASSDHSAKSSKGARLFITFSCIVVLDIDNDDAETYWVRYDLWIGAVAALVQVACNETRLLLVSINRPMFDYWHEGAGAHFFAGAATLAAVLIALFGAQWAGQRRLRAQRTFAAGVI